MFIASKRAMHCWTRVIRAPRHGYASRKQSAIWSGGGAIDAIASAALFECVARRFRCNEENERQEAGEELTLTKPITCRLFRPAQ